MNITLRDAEIISYALYIASTEGAIDRDSLEFLSRLCTAFPELELAPRLASLEAELDTQETDNAWDNLSDEDALEYQRQADNESAEQ